MLTCNNKVKTYFYALSSALTFMCWFHYFISLVTIL